jgi:lipid-binding SYLF domain-containing protein
VFPQVINASFLVGGEGGRGVVSRRTETGWSDPVYFRAGGASVGRSGEHQQPILLFCL